MIRFEDEIPGIDDEEVERDRYRLGPDGQLEVIDYGDDEEAGDDEEEGEDEEEEEDDGDDEDEVD